jgi:amino acid transporter
MVYLKSIWILASKEQVCTGVAYLGAIVISLLFCAVMAMNIYLVLQKKRLVTNIIGVAFVVFVVITIVFRISLDPSNSALARAVLHANGNPTKIAGTVQEKGVTKLRSKPILVKR